MTDGETWLQRLIEAHPALFRGRPPALGGSVSPGWYDLVHRLCSDIEAALGAEATAACSVAQIKEKVGELRFYIEGAGGTGVQRIIDVAQERSTSICSECGAPGQVVEVSGSYKTLCKAHFAGAAKGRHTETAVPLAARPARAHHTSSSTMRGVARESERPDVLYLDFDGVLHPESVWWSRKRGAFLDAKLVAMGHRLFEHCDLLEELLLPYPAVRIVLSTSWVRTYSYSEACKRLHATVRQRCVGATFHSEMYLPGYEAQSRGVQVLSDVRRRRPRRWLALDDVNDGWGEHLDDVVLTDELEGIANAAVMTEIQRKLSRFRGAA